MPEERKQVVDAENVDWGVEGGNTEAQNAKRMMFEQFLRRGMTVISERSIEHTELIGSDH